MTRILLHYNGFVLPLEVDEHRPFNQILRDGHELAALCGVSERDYLTCEIPEQPQGLRPIGQILEPIVERAELAEMSRSIADAIRTIVVAKEGGASKAETS